MYIFIEKTNGKWSYNGKIGIIHKVDFENSTHTNATVVTLDKCKLIVDLSEQIAKIEQLYQSSLNFGIKIQDGKYWLWADDASQQKFMGLLLMLQALSPPTVKIMCKTGCVHEITKEEAYSVLTEYATKLQQLWNTKADKIERLMLD